MITPDDRIAEYIKACVRAEAAEIEAVCERSIQFGEHGVLVLRGPCGELLSASVDPSVPYGFIYEEGGS